MTGGGFEPVQAPPERCPECGGASLEIVYGEPPMEMVAAEEAGEIVIAGCCIDITDPDRQCRACGHQWQTPEFGADRRRFLDPYYVPGE